MRARAVLALFAAAALAAPASAEAPGPDPGPCRADFEKHCAGVERGGAMGRCLREHEKELSPACRDHLAARHEQRKERAHAVFAACRNDVSEHCPDQRPGEGGLIRCLRDHQAELSEPCRDALPERERHGP